MQPTPATIGAVPELTEVWDFSTGFALDLEMMQKARQMEKDSTSQLGVTIPSSLEEGCREQTGYDPGPTLWIGKGDQGFPQVRSDWLLWRRRTAQASTAVTGTPLR